MKPIITASVLAFVAACLSGCGHEHAGAQDEKVKANLAKLGDEDQNLAAAQGYCAVESENRLGAMGPPVKVMVKDQPVFLCCKSCKDEALKDPDKTLERVAELKKRAQEK
jgi:hypothetical protein